MMAMMKDWRRMAARLKGRSGSEGKNKHEAGEDEDGAGGMAEIPLQAPAEGGLFFAAEDAEEDVVDNVRTDDGRADEEDDEEPAVAEMNLGGGWV